MHVCARACPLVARSARSLVAVALLLLASPVSSAPRLFPSLPSPARHALYARHFTQPPELAQYASRPNCSSFCAGFAAVRDFDMSSNSSWAPTLDLYLGEEQDGGLGLGNIVWPSYHAALSPAWPQLAALLRSRGVAATDLAGFVPGGVQDFDARSAEPSFSAGAAVLGSLYLGFDMGEQDVRYLWGYAHHVSLPGPSQRAEQLAAFLDYSSNIELKAEGRLVALSSSVYAVHHWAKSGLYTLLGSETSQSNGNAQILLAFDRGAAKAYGSLWYGQVSIFNWYGYKIPGDPSPSPDCVDQSSHGPTCGTSLNLMKRLLYSQLAYDAAYFAFEGMWLFEGNNSLTPIGRMQQRARRFAIESAELHGGLGLGVHVPTVAVMLDFVGGWTRPCDTRPHAYTPAAWGNLPWDAADFLADAVMDALAPGYRAGTQLRNETGTMAPTPFGDAFDVLLSDAAPSVLALYDTIVLAHRAEAEPAALQRRLGRFLAGGGNVWASASSLGDLGGLAGVTVGGCVSQPAGTHVAVAGAADIVEALAFDLCGLTFSGPFEALATVGGQVAAARVAVGKGSLTIVAAGSYGMSTAANAGALYSCLPDEPDSRDSQALRMAAFTRHFLEQSLGAASTFDLGGSLAWVPKRIAPALYSLTVTNPQLWEVPLAIASRLGAVAKVIEVPLDQSEKGEVGYLPHGFEGADIGHSTNSTVAGGDTRVFIVTLESDSSTEIPTPAGPPPEAAWAARRLLRLQPGTGNLRRQIIARPSFEVAFGGVLIDSDYLYARSPAALAREAAWLQSRRVRIVVDFSASTTLFPGVRLCDDMGGYYAESMAMLRDVIAKMPLVGSRDALLTLHDTSELPPANFSSGDPTGLTRASIVATLQTLAAEAAGLNVSLHLRRSSRNDNMAGGGLGKQAAFAASAGVKIAPALAYAQISGDQAADAASLLQSGAASLLLLSSAWQAPAGRSVEGGALAALPGAQLPFLRQVHAAAMAAPGALVVLDAGYDSGEVAGREQELADADFLEAALQGA